MSRRENFPQADSKEDRFDEENQWLTSVIDLSLDRAA